MTRPPILHARSIRDISSSRGMLIIPDAGVRCLIAPPSDHRAQRRGRMARFDVALSKWARQGDNVGTTLRWLGFAGGVIISMGTVVGVMKSLIVPRRAWSLLPATIGRYGFRLFHAVAIRLHSYDRADRFLGFLAPTVIIGILASFPRLFRGRLRTAPAAVGGTHGLGRAARERGRRFHPRHGVRVPSPCRRPSTSRPAPPG